MIHHYSLDLLTFFTQVKDGPQTVVHEHTPNRITDGTFSQPVNMFTKF